MLIHQDIIDGIKAQKMLIVNGTDRGDMPPLALAFRDKYLISLAMAPKIQKELGLYAAAILKSAFDPDAIMLVTDAHVALSKKSDTVADFQKRYPRGTMQKMCDEQGACETGEITDCLTCNRIFRNGVQEMVVLPYSYHGKGTTFKWLPTDDDMLSMTTAGGTGRLGGDIPDTLTEIMTKERLMIDDPRLQPLIRAFGPENRDALLYRTGRAAERMLREQDFTVMDMPSR